jgi:anti-sigma factor NepR-like protein
MKERKPLSPETPPTSAAPSGSENLMHTSMNPKKNEVRLGRDAQIRIGQQLRALYDDVVNEGVPDHIADLVRKLSEQDDEGSRE